MESVPTPTALEPTAADPAGEPTVGAGEAAADEVTQEDIDAIDSVLDAVEQSLTRIDAGQYGRCEECGGLIDDTLLAEDPTGRRCQTCPPPALD
jgi:RNA polymerase-binding transcription factor DksA